MNQPQSPTEQIPATAGPPPGEGKSSAGGAHSSPAAAVRTEFLWKIHSYTNEYIRFADAKAGAALGFASAVAAGLFSVTQAAFSGLSYSPQNPSVWLTTWALGASLAYCLLVLGVGCSVVAIWPRRWPTVGSLEKPQAAGSPPEEPNCLKVALRWVAGRCCRAWKFLFRPDQAPPPAMIFWESILQYPGPEQYSVAVGKSTADEQADQVAHHVHVLAGVCSAKYSWTASAIRFVFFGAILSAIAGASSPKLKGASDGQPSAEVLESSPSGSVRP